MELHTSGGGDTGLDGKTGTSSVEGCPFAEAEPITLPIDRGVFDPPEELGRLRERAPLCRMRFTDGHVGWLVTSYELAKQVLGDRRFSLFPVRHAVGDPEQRFGFVVEWLRGDVRLAEVFDRYLNSGRAEYEAFDDPEVLNILRSDPSSNVTIFSDPPRHDQIRRIVAGYFTPRRVNGHRQLVEDIVARQLDAMEQDGSSLDLVKTFCLPITSQVICVLFGASPAERDRFEEPTSLLSDPQASAQQKAEAFLAIIDFVRELVQRKRADPGDDLISGLVRDGQLNDDELVSLVRFLFTAGFETTANTLALSVLTLLHNRTGWDAMCADPEMVGTAVEEMLRFHTQLKLNAFTRTALEDIEIAGQTIRAGETVAVSLAAANRDPERFKDPDQLDLARADAAGHVGFGHGIHQCLGQHLARLELRISLTALTSRFPQLRLAVPIEEVPMYADDNTFHGMHRLPVTW